MRREGGCFGEWEAGDTGRSVSENAQVLCGRPAYDTLGWDTRVVAWSFKKSRKMVRGDFEHPMSHAWKGTAARCYGFAISKSISHHLRYFLAVRKTRASVLNSCCPDFRPEIRHSPLEAQIIFSAKDN